MNVITGSRYLGGFIDDQVFGETCLEEKVEGWVALVRTLLGVDRKHLKTSYAGLEKSLQQEWAFVQQVTPNIGGAFSPVDYALQDYFPSALFNGRRGWNPTAGGHTLVSESGGSGPPRPHKYVP